MNSKSMIDQTLDAYDVVVAGGKERERLLNKIVEQQEDVIKLLREKVELLQKWFDAGRCDFFGSESPGCTLPKGHTGVHVTIIKDPP